MPQDQESRFDSKKRVSLSLRTSKDSGNSFINDNYAFMSLGALNDPQRVVVSPERALSVNRLPCTNSQVRPKAGTSKISCAEFMQRSAAISAIVLSLVCAPAAISQQPAPATSQSNNDVESARSHPLTVPVPKPRNATTVDPPSEEGPSFVRVTSDGNQLMIQARDCALSQILDAVRAKTGANIDVSGGAAEHMTVNIGPGPAPSDLFASWLDRLRLRDSGLGCGRRDDSEHHAVPQDKAHVKPGSSHARFGTQPAADGRSAKHGSGASNPSRCS